MATKGSKGDVGAVLCLDCGGDYRTVSICLVATGSINQAESTGPEHAKILKTFYIGISVMNQEGPALTIFLSG